MNLSKDDTFDCKVKKWQEYVRDNCIRNPIAIEPPTPTCLITSDMIDRITTFLCDIIPDNNNNDINLLDFKYGKILNKGSFGYTFELRNEEDDENRKRYDNTYNYKDLLIKIIVCLPNIANMKDILKKEIEIHSLLSKYDTTNYIQLYGYYIKGDDNNYYYTDINQNETKQVVHTKPKLYFNDYCEIYLIMHKGLKDVASYIGRIFDDYTYKTYINDVKDIFDMLNAFRVSNEIIKNEHKIFIHSDIKAENIVRAYDYKLEKYNLKLIDFGLSKLSTNFFMDSSDGTEFIFKLLFTHQIIDSSTNTKREIYDNRLAMVSPLFDIFSIILVMFELFIKRRMNTQEYNIDKIKDTMQIYANNQQQTNKILYKNITQLIIIFNSIHKFHQIRIKQYYDNVLESDSLVGWLKGFISKNPLQKYIESYDIKDFKLSDIGDIVQPEYINSGNKLADDMNYLTRLIDFALTLDFE